MNDTPYMDLSPDLVLDAVESTGRRCTGVLLPLNSFENRVYQVGVEDAEPLVVKFYRPGRWSDETILEEHTFALELAEAEIPVVAPLVEGGRSLHHHSRYRFAIFPRRGGRAPEPGDLDQLEWIGRFMGRIHAIGARASFRHRPSVDVQSYARDACTWLQSNDSVPDDLLPAWNSTMEALLPRLEDAFSLADGFRCIRLHGDCHPGNILWTDAGPHFVDLDDCRSGPAVQDLWMLLSGDRQEMTLQLDSVLEGYRDFADFDPRELHLIEALRTMRMLHHSSWLAQRWVDPAFPAAFPWFGTQRYWQDQVLALREQLALLDEPPLSVQ